ncbi:MAG TPA: ethanolamine permease [Chitinophagaceae bacterium]|nr:ethanolamine permease [Chitinophagaceae bacterium]
MSNPSRSLRKVLKPVHLWALAVGLVISGEYFGWNYGWEVAGTVGLLVSTLLVTVLYITFIFSFTELTSAIPNAGGPFAYAYQAFGPVGGMIAGYSTLIEFIFAPPAIAFALGSYVNFLNADIPVMYTAVGCYVIFTAINMLGIKESALFNMVVTVLALLGLLIFFVLTIPHFDQQKFLAHNDKFGLSGVFAALPFAIWFYLGIEGVAMVAEEVIDPQKNIPKGYLLGMSTLVLITLGVIILAGGVGDWRQLVKIDYPLPAAMSQAIGKENFLTKLFAFIGLFGLIASFHGLIIGYSRQIFALSRSHFLPGVLSRVNSRFRTPHWALVAGGIIGLICLATGTTDKVIIISALGAVVMYAISMISLLKLHKEIRSVAGFKTPFFPWFPVIALVLSMVCLAAIAYYNPLLTLIFFGGLIAGLALFVLTGRNKMDQEPSGDI